MKVFDKAKDKILEPVTRVYYLAIAALITAVIAIAVAVSK